MTDDEYEIAINKFLALAADRLCESKGNLEKIKRAIEQYLEEGDALDMSPLELRDYFDISTPGLPQQTGFSHSEAESASELFDQISAARYGA